MIWIECIVASLALACAVGARLKERREAHEELARRQRHRLGL